MFQQQPAKVMMNVPMTDTAIQERKAAMIHASQKAARRIIIAMLLITVVYAVSILKN